MSLKPTVLLFYSKQCFVSKHLAPKAEYFTFNRSTVIVNCLRFDAVVILFKHD